MGPSNYIAPGEYTAYGLPAGTTADQVSTASVYVDAHLKRPEGLVWQADSTGNPCCMLAPAPSLSFSLSAPIAPGQNVVASVSGPLGGLQVGDALIADRSTDNTREALSIVSTAPGQITFSKVLNAHGSGTALDADLCITEQRYLPKNRPIVVLGRSPIQRIISGTGRYAYPRRGDAGASNTDDFNLLAVYDTFGGPPAWEVFKPEATEFDARTGQVWVPAGIMLAYYTEIRIRYVAGFSAAAIPTQIKLATAKLVKVLANDPDLGPVKSYRAGDTAVQLFANTLISGDLADMLKPYRARGFV